MMLPKEPEIPKAPAPPPALTAEAGGGDEALLARLKELRKDIALVARVPAYIVFSDASLMDMCRKRPRDPSRFLEVSGVGPAKLEKYGDAFIALIRAHCEAEESLK
jgi:ATP-dependent DNA helicase RecQ